jgi:hypothetical protein
VVTSVTGTRASAGRANQARRRSVRVGHSWDGAAGKAGAGATLDALQLAEPRLLVVFASFGYDLPELLHGVHSVAGDVPVIGCSTAGEIGPGPAQSRGVVVVALGGDFTVATTHAAGLREGAREVGERVARGLLPLPDTRYRATLMLTDTLAGDQQEMIRGAYGVLGATIPLIGGGAGDDMRMETSYQFHNGRILQEAVVAATIGSDDPIGLAVRHGWRRSGDAMVVTGSAGSEVHTLDDRPALDVYLERHGAPPGIETDPSAFVEFALTRPLTIARRGDAAVRHVLGADPASRTLTCGGGIPRGAAAWLASGGVESTLAATDAACADAIGQLGEVPLLALLVFDCVGRRAVLGEEGMLAERRFMAERAGIAPLAGFYSYGEIARTKGVVGFHNQTVLAVALS